MNLTGLGLATHYKPARKTACGSVVGSHFTDDPKKVDCQRCLASMNPPPALEPKREFRQR